MFYLSSTDRRIAAAKQAGTINIAAHSGRNGGYFAVCDGDDLIAIALTAQEAADMVRGHYKPAERLV